MDAYYSTPNLIIPLNDREPGEIADIAKEQLAYWRGIADTWPVYTDGRCNRCKECHQNIWFSRDPQGHEYNYVADEIPALKVAHVRQCHAQERLYQVLDIPYDNATGGSGSSDPN